MVIRADNMIYEAGGVHNTQEEAHTPEYYPDWQRGRVNQAREHVKVGDVMCIEPKAAIPDSRLTSDKASRCNRRHFHLPAFRHIVTCHSIKDSRTSPLEISGKIATPSDLHDN